MKWKEIIVSNDNKRFLYKGKELFNQSFFEVLKFHAPGLAPVSDKSGWYHINLEGQELYAERYDRSFGFYNNRASVVKDSLWFHITEKGAAAYTHRFKWTGNFQENLCTVRNEKNRYFHIKLDGGKLYDDTYVYAGDFKDGIACVKNGNGMFKHIDSKGNNVNSLEFLDLGIFHKNFARAKDELGWHHIDKSGKAIYQDRFLMVEPFYNGQALVTKFDGKKAIIDENGKEIIEV